MDRRLFGGPLSEEASMDRKPPLSRTPPKSGGLSGQEALLVIWPFWIKDPQSRGLWDRRPRLSEGYLPGGPLSHD